MVAIRVVLEGAIDNLPPFCKVDDGDLLYKILIGDFDHPVHGPGKVGFRETGRRSFDGYPIYRQIGWEPSAGDE